MNRRKFVLAAGSCAAGTWAAASGLDQNHDLEAKAEEPGQSPAHSRPAAKKPHRPNVVFIICDDLGYGDLPCYGSKLETPNIDRLAAGGMRFTSHTTPAAICSASRAAVLTGRYGVRGGVTGAYMPLSDDGLDLSATTTADVLRSAGYRTMAVGKWHLGDLKEYMPTRRGFDEYYGVPYSVDMDPLPLLHNTTIVEPEADRDALTRKYTEKAVDFIGKRGENKPFFLYMAHSYPHIPLHASQKFRGSTKAGDYGDVVREIDWSVGEIMSALKANGIERNTLVIFTSDHGPWFLGGTGVLRGRKNTTYEGGVRIPMIASMAGAIPPGKANHAFSSHTDFLPTFAGLCGGELPKQPMDGSDIWPLLSGERAQVDRKAALISFQQWNAECARLGPWKLHIARMSDPPFLPPLRDGSANYSLRNPELYNMDDDPSESYDVAAEHPDIVAAIKKSIAEQIATLPAEAQQAYLASQQRPSNPAMPAGSFPEFANSSPGNGAWMQGPKAHEVLKRFD